MKLDDLHIYAFGGLKDIKIDFNSGLTCINKENGWGKTTLATFIKSMFFGLKDSKSSVERNERKRFYPWGFVGKFGGKLRYTHDGKSYEVLRLFGEKISQDEFTLVDLSSGKVLSNDSTNFGEDLFGIDEEGFLSTVFCPQSEVKISIKNLAYDNENSVNSASSQFDYEKAKKTIETRAKNFKAERGEKGLIYELKSKIYSVEENVNLAKSALREIDELKAQLSKLKIEEEILKKECDDLSSAIIVSNGKVLSVRNQLIDEIEHEKTRLFNEKAQAEKILGDERPDEQKLKTLIECAKDLPYIEKKLEEEKMRQKRSSLHKILLLVISILAIGVAGTFLAFGMGVYSTFLFVFGVGFFGAYIFLSVRYNREASKKRGVDYLQLKETYVKEINRFLSLFFRDDFVKNNGFLFCLSEIQSAITLKNEAQSNINRLEEKLKKLAVDDENQGAIERSDDIKIKLTEKKAELYEKVENINRITLRIEMLEQKADLLIDYEFEKAQLEDKLKSAKEEYEVLKLTLEFLKKANDELKCKYKRPIEERVNFYLRQVLGEKLSVQIDLDFNVYGVEAVGIRESAFYSRGLRDVLSICTRFAIIDVMFGENCSFIILDDPFYNLDGEKFDKCSETLKTFAQNRQIIYLTCHESRVIN